MDEIEADGSGLVMCMGKGGVGKTTVAAAVAVALAERGHEVLLTTTDPAAHLTDTLGGVVEGLDGDADRPGKRAPAVPHPRHGDEGQGTWMRRAGQPWPKT